MINLLPNDNKAEIRAGRLNAILLNYILMTILAIALLAVLLALAYVTLTPARLAAQNRVAENEATIAKFDNVKAAATTYRSDLATAKQILDKSIDYSKLILKVAHDIPEGAALSTLSLDAKTVGQPTTLTVYAKDSATVLAIKRSFETDTKLFSDVSFQQIMLNETPTPSLPYQYSVVINVTIAKEALQ